MPGDIMRYNAFLADNYPYVQPDGSILSKQQQLEIWKAQRTTQGKAKAKLHGE
jgi:hypothetical protein